MHIKFPIRFRSDDDGVIVVEEPATGPHDVGAPGSVDRIVDAYTRQYGEPIVSTTDDGRWVWTWRNRPQVDG